MVNGKCNVTLGQVEMSHSNSELSWLSDVSYSAAFFYILLTLATMSYRSDQTTYGCNSLTPKLNEICWWLCLWIPLNICRKSVFLIVLFKVKLDNFFCLTLSILYITWLNSIIVVEKMTPFAAKLVSNKPCFYHAISLPPGPACRRTMKNQWLSLLSVLIGRSTLCILATGDVGTSWLAHRALTLLRQQQSVFKPPGQSARAQAEANQFTPLQLSLQPFHLSSKWT